MADACSVEAAQLIEAIGNGFDVDGVSFLLQFSEKIARYASQHDDAVVPERPFGQSGLRSIVGNEFAFGGFLLVLALCRTAFITKSVHGRDGIIARIIVGNGQIADFLT